MTVRFVLVIAALGPLAGCGIFGPSASTPEGRCDAAAYDDPTVKQIIVERVSGNDEKSQELLTTQEDAVKRAKIRCLRGVGAAPPGGVEPLKPSR